MPQVVNLNMQTGFVLDWSSLYKVNGMICGYIGIYTALSFTAGTSVLVATFDDYPSVSNCVFPVYDSYATCDYLGTFFVDNFNKTMTFNPAKSFTEGRLSTVVIAKAH